MTGKPSSASLHQIPLYVKYPLCGIVLCLAGTILLFYGTVVVGSFTKQWPFDYSFSLENYVWSFQFGGEYLKDTILIAAASTPIAGILGMIIAFLVVRQHFPGKGVLEFSSMLTFALPGTVVGIGYILAFNQKPFLLTGTATIIGLAFIFRNMPVGVRAGIASLHQIDPAIEEASTNLGAGTVRTFSQVLLPMIFPALFAGMAYTFVKCMTAISAVIFLVSGKWQLATVAILGAVDNGLYGAAAALSVLVILISLLALGLMWIFVGRSALERIVQGGR
ncbi:MAG: iron ABC transporter permease [Nitrospinota bacterium]|nr:MAG: iron ABC transporter permease [Nitrospinota bacterium]